MDPKLKDTADFDDTDSDFSDDEEQSESFMEWLEDKVTSSPTVTKANSVVKKSWSGAKRVWWGVTNLSWICSSSFFMLMLPLFLAINTEAAMYEQMQQAQAQAQMGTTSPLAIPSTTSLPTGLPPATTTK